ncbi:MAG: TlpA disulfide reductase family protein [Candidatus Thiodiazotropha sp.]|jgi:peroxiredoxin
MIRSLPMPGVLLLLLWLAASVAAGQGLIPLADPQPAPPFQLQDADGNPHRLEDYRGRVVIVNFWSSWCAPCRHELPSMNRAWTMLKDEGVVMLALNLGEELGAVRGFLRNYPIDFPVLLDLNANVSDRWELTALPTTFVLDVRGRIVYRVIGEREWDSEPLLRQIRALQQQGRDDEQRPHEASP